MFEAIKRGFTVPGCCVNPGARREVVDFRKSRTAKGCTGGVEITQHAVRRRQDAETFPAFAWICGNHFEYLQRTFEISCAEA